MAELLMEDGRTIQCQSGTCPSCPAAGLCNCSCHGRGTVGSPRDEKSPYDQPMWDAIFLNCPYCAAAVSASLMGKHRDWHLANDRHAGG